MGLFLEDALRSSLIYRQKTSINLLIDTLSSAAASGPNGFGQDGWDVADVAVNAAAAYLCLFRPLTNVCSGKVHHCGRDSHLTPFLSETCRWPMYEVTAVTSVSSCVILYYSCFVLFFGGRITSTKTRVNAGTRFKFRSRLIMINRDQNFNRG